MTRTERAAIVSAAFIAGLIGGVLGSRGSFVPRAEASSGMNQRFTAGSFQVFDDRGKLYARLDKLTQDGSALFFFDGKGGPRAEIGTYENGVPLVGLMGDQGTPKVLIREAGGNDSGVIVFKDKGNHDRMILGLDMNAPDEEPFLVTFDKNGKKHVVFGNFTNANH